MTLRAGELKVNPLFAISRKLGRSRAPSETKPESPQGPWAWSFSPIPALGCGRSPKDRASQLPAIGPGRYGIARGRTLQQVD